MPVCVGMEVEGVIPHSIGVMLNLSKVLSKGSDMDSNTSAHEHGTRLREHPVARFEGAQHVLDLNQLSQKLQAEAHEPTRGHRQEAIYHYGSVTMVLFAFEAGGEMPQHQTNGVVTIQVLEGVLNVTAEGHSHDLQASQILVLQPNVPHSVRGVEAARMLLTVHLHGDKHQDAPHRVAGPESL